MRRWSVAASRLSRRIQAAQRTPPAVLSYARVACHAADGFAHTLSTALLSRGLPLKRTRWVVTGCGQLEQARHAPALNAQPPVAAQPGHPTCRPQAVPSKDRTTSAAAVSTLVCVYLCVCVAMGIPTLHRATLFAAGCRSPAAADLGAQLLLRFPRWEARGPAAAARVAFCLSAHASLAAVLDARASSLPAPVPTPSQPNRCTGRCPLFLAGRWWAVLLGALELQCDNYGPHQVWLMTAPLQVQHPSRGRMRAQAAPSGCGRRRRPPSSHFLHPRTALNRCCRSAFGLSCSAEPAQQARRAKSVWTFRSPPPQAAVARPCNRRARRGPVGAAVGRAGRGRRRRRRHRRFAPPPPAGPLTTSSLPTPRPSNL